MKKIVSISLSLIAANVLVACGPTQMMPNNVAAQNAIRSMSAANSGARTLNLNKTASPNVKQGTTELQMQSKNQAKAAAPLQITLEPARRDLPTSSVMTIARLGLDNMERARTYEDGYNIGRSTVDTLANQNSYIARLTQAATNPQMGYESAYKATSYGLSFIANNRDISIANACDLVRQMMNGAKTYEDGARMGYGTLAFIRQSASPSIQAVIDSSVRSAQQARYWEDVYNILNSAFSSIRYMN